MRNPFEQPQPKPLDPEDYWDIPNFRVESLFTKPALMDLIDRNHDWLVHEPRSTRDIYKALINPMDRGATNMLRIVPTLNAVLWEYGFGMEQVPPPPIWNLTWRWHEPA